MLSKIPINLEKIKQDDLDKEILRAAIIAGLDAITLYKEMVSFEKIRISKPCFLMLLKKKNKLKS